MNKKISIPLLLLFFASVACVSDIRTQAPSATETASAQDLQATIAAQNTQIASIGVQQTTVLPDPQEQPNNTPIAGTTVDPCMSDEWKLYPININQYSIADGWKLLLVEMAVENRSPFYGTVATASLRTQVTVTTEEGFTYKVYEKVGVRELPEDNIWLKGLDYGINGINPGHIPPGAIVRGYGTPDSLTLADVPFIPFFYIFRVPESQQRFHVRIEDIWLGCDLENGEKGSQYITKEFDLGENVMEFTGEPDFALSDLFSSATIESADDKQKMSIEFTEVEREPIDDEKDIVIVRYQITSLDRGEQLSGSIRHSLIGNDGIFRLDCHTFMICRAHEHADEFQNRYSLGPNQHNEQAFAFLVPNHIEDIWLVLDRPFKPEAFRIPK